MMGQQPGLDQRHRDKNGETSPDETQAERGGRVIRENSSPETIEDGTDKGAAGTAAGRQESPEERRARIAEIAYRKAGERGFAPGGELEDWLAAEREVAADPRAGRLG
jgi:hypothetical protein